MRYAKAAQLRRQLRTKQHEWSIRLSRFAVEDVPSLGTLEVPISSPLTVISGANGAGKTTLLRALWAALDPAAAASCTRGDPRLSAGRVEASLTRGDAKHELTASFPVTDGDMPPHEAAIIHLDAAAETRHLQELFLSFESVEEFTNGIAAREMKPDELSEISYIVARDYRNMRLYEVEIGEDSVAPFLKLLMETIPTIAEVWDPANSAHCRFGGS